MLTETRLWPEQIRHDGVILGAPVPAVVVATSAPRRDRCRSCGATPRAHATVCRACGSPVDETRAYATPSRRGVESTTVATPRVVEAESQAAWDSAWLEMIAAAERAGCSPAELVWESLAGEEQTAVWSPEHTAAGVEAWPSANGADANEVTRVDRMCEYDTAQHTAITLQLPPPAPMVEARPPVEAAVLTTSRMPAIRAALLLQLAPTGFAGSGTPIDAAVVPRGRLLDVGRGCAGPWAGDPYLDELHVRLLTDVDGVRVIDAGSRGGVWLRIDGAHWLRDGDWFRIGEQFLCYDAPAEDAADRGSWGCIQLIDHELRFGPAIEIVDETVLGRAAPDVVLLHDPFVSAEHCRIVPDDRGLVLEDLDSSNGTWVRLCSGDLIPFGGVVAIGRSVYRVEAAEADPEPR